MDNSTELQAKVVITGTLEFRDKDGKLVKTMEMIAEIPQDQKEPENGNQRSE